MNRTESALVRVFRGDQLSRAQAESLFAWAVEQNPQPWADHCKNVAFAAETIAKNCGLDADRAYIYGLFHDIGYHAYRNGKGRSSHIYIGYEFMMEKGCPDIAGICLTHSFPYQDINSYAGSDLTFCTEDELKFITKFLQDAVYDHYDKLIQLCDCLATAQGVCLLEKRMMDVAMRHGVIELGPQKWKATFDAKKHFDEMYGGNIYNLFREQIIADVFGK